MESSPAMDGEDPGSPTSHVEVHAPTPPPMNHDDLPGSGASSSTRPVTGASHSSQPSEASSAYAVYPDSSAPVTTTALAAPPFGNIQQRRPKHPRFSNNPSAETSQHDLPSGISTPPTSLGRRERTFTSNLVKEPINKPWLEKPDPWLKRARYFFLFFMAWGILGGMAYIYFGYKSVPHLGDICLVFDDEFDSFNTTAWTREVELSGWGNGEFEWTTNSDNNSYVENGMLYILPTLTADQLGQAAVFNGYNLTAPGCTSQNFTDCNAVSNSTMGTVINPVQSARLSTRKSVSIKYGRVEVSAKMPTGDWLWPAIWMLPVESVYGPWPRSGEIDIVEARGNPPSYQAQGSDWLTSTIHWGPNSILDRFWTTVGWWNNRHLTYNEGFHTYVLEWDEDFMWMYVDSRINRIFNFRFAQTFFNLGQFPATVFNGSQEVLLQNPWAGGVPNVAPFDQSFYLILDVAVGGTNGWFPDGVGDKPWVDASTTAMRDFANAQSQWYPTWPTDPTKRAMVIDYVKMWQKC